MTIRAAARFVVMLCTALGCPLVVRGQQRPTGFVVPKAIGYVNDFAKVIPDSTRRSIEATLLQLRKRTEGEVVVVTRASLEGLDVSDMARRFGNTWGVGASTGRARQAGAIVLLIPKETSADGRGYCRIELGDGATKFIPDSAASAICVAATPAFRARQYGEALRGIVLALSKRYDEALR